MVETYHIRWFWCKQVSGEILTTPIREIVCISEKIMKKELSKIKKHMPKKTTWKLSANCFKVRTETINICQ